MSKRKDSTVTIVIPTFRRPEALGRALESALAQKAEGFTIKVIVVDNDAFGSARTVCEGKRRVTYVSEPRAGVSHARNTGLANVTSRYVFFLDDDMLAERGCVQSLLDAAQRYGAGVSFAAVNARMPGDSALEEHMKPFFSRRRDKAEGVTTESMGAGGSLFDLSLCPLPSPAFDPALNETGGEDDRLLSYLQRKGVSFAWVPSAQTIEDVPAHRATLAYVWKRNFAFGQGPSQIAADRALELADKKAWLHVAKWMGVGVGQCGLRLPAWLFTRILDLPRHAHWHAQLAQGMGKVLWWGNFKQVLYGDTVTHGQDPVINTIGKQA
jgi:succinoglycan biosynthesis protein ExoM